MEEGVCQCLKGPSMERFVEGGREAGHPFLSVVETWSLEIKRTCFGAQVLPL